MKKWKKGESGNPKGRPKKIETVIKEHFLEEHNLKLTKTQSQDIIKNILGKTRKELDLRDDRTRGRPEPG